MTVPEPLDWAAVQRNPHAEFARHRANGWYAPIAHSDMIEVLSYNDARLLMAADDRMLEYLGGHLDDMIASNPNLPSELREAMRERSAVSLINLDGEPHHVLRAAVARAFTPRAVAQFRPQLEALAAGLASQLKPGDDFVVGFARELPARAICAIVGIPEEDHERFASWIDVLQVQLSPTELMALRPDQAADVLAVHRELDAYTRTLVESRRREPAEDVVSRLALDEEQFDTGTVAALVSDLIFAGNDTTRKALGLMVMALAEQPGVWERIAVEPDYAPAVVEEVLRLHSPALGPVRRACTRFEHSGTTIEAGQVAALSIWSANYDESFWGPTASGFDTQRPETGQHLSFGHGPHFCLGASLAREEMRAALIALSAQITELEILSPPPMTPVGSIYGPLSLRLGFRRR